MKNELFSKTIKVDDNRLISVVELPDGCIKIEAVTINDKFIQERYQGRMIAITKKAAAALRDILCQIVLN